MVEYIPSSDIKSIFEHHGRLLGWLRTQSVLELYMHTHHTKPIPLMIRKESQADH